MVTSDSPLNNSLGVPAGSEGADSAGAIQGQRLEQPVQTAELAIDDLPATAHKDKSFSIYLLICFACTNPMLCFVMVILKSEVEAKEKPKRLNNNKKKYTFLSIQSDPGLWKQKPLTLIMNSTQLFFQNKKQL